MDKSMLRQHARDLRKNSTNAERHLWRYTPFRKPYRDTSLDSLNLPGR